MIVQPLTLAVAASIAALRATPGDPLVVVATTRAGVVQLYLWNASSTAPDDGINIVAPNPAVPGRWVLRSTLAGGEAPAVALVMAVAWSGTRVALQLAQGWSVIGADAVNVYIAEVLP